MEKKQRTNTMDSAPPSPQEAAASLDPLVQPINDQEGIPVYIRQRSSIFYVPNSTINENGEETSPQTKSKITRCLAYTERFSGILYALFASLLFTCSNFLLKQLNVGILDVLLIRFFVQSVISFGFVLYKGYRPFPACNALLVFIRSLFAGGGSISFYLGLTLLPLPDLTTIQYTQVVWTALLALIIFRERITLPTIIASLLTLTGVICVAQPTFLFPQPKVSNETFQERIQVDRNQRLFGMLVALACALSISMSIVLNKKLLQLQVRQSIIMLYFQLITFLVLLIMQTRYWLFSESDERKLLFRDVFLTRNFIFATIISILQLFPMILSQKAIKREHPSIVTVVQSSDILFAIILQNVFTVIKTNFLALAGSVLVLASICIIGGHKLWLDRQNRTCLLPSSIQENVLSVQEKT